MGAPAKSSEYFRFRGAQLKNVFDNKSGDVWNLRKQHWDSYSETMRTGITQYGAGDVLAVPALRKDGTRVSIEFSILPFRDKEGRIVGVAAILRDVSKRLEGLRSLREQVAELRRQAPAAV